MSSKRELKVVVSAKDEASSKLKKMTANIQAGLKKTAIVAGVAGGALAVAIKKSVDAFQAQERAEKKLETITKQTTNATDDQIKALKEQAAALQKVGIIGDEVTMVGQAQLGTFALTTDSIETLTPALLDMAANIKGVNTTQEDMMNIANLVGKVMQGQVGALTRYGVSLTDAQAEQIKMGNEMERAAVVAEVLNQNFGGLNEALAETSEGQMQQLKNSFGDMLETIGEAVIPMLTDLVKSIQPIVENIATWVSNNQELVAGIVKTAAVILPLLIVLPLLVSAISAVGTVLLFVAANPIVLVVAAIAGLIAAIVLLIKNWDKVKAKVIDVWRAISAEIGVRIAAIKLMLIGWMESLKAGLEQGWNLIKDGWSAFWDGMKQVAEAAVAFITGIIDKIAGTIMRVIEKIEELKEKAKAGLSAAGGAISGAASRVAGVFRAHGGNVFPGQVVTVGERGPETLVMGQSGRIIPNAPGGGTVVQVNVTGNTMLSEAPEVAEKIGDMIINQLRLQIPLS